jgi:hypothetical protein
MPRGRIGPSSAAGFVPIPLAAAGGKGWAAHPKSIRREPLAERQRVSDAKRFRRLRTRRARTEDQSTAPGVRYINGTSLYDQGCMDRSQLRLGQGHAAS